MHKTLPLVVATLSLHGTAVTLEGLLLAQRKFLALNWIYSFVASSILVLFAYVRKAKLGLAGVWGCYVWFQGSRIALFSLATGLVRLGLRNKQQTAGED